MSDVSEIQSDLMDMRKRINEHLSDFEKKHSGVFIENIELVRLEWQMTDTAKHTLPSVEIDVRIK